MQNKGLVKLFAILFGLVSLYSLSFTFFSKKIERDAVVYALNHTKTNDKKDISNLEYRYLDSISKLKSILGFGEFTYRDLKDKEINLGLDLKGGINAVLEISVRSILMKLSDNSENPVFKTALEAASTAQKKSSKNYLDLFYEEFEKIAGETKLNDPSIFRTEKLKNKIHSDTSNSEIRNILSSEIDASISTAFQILRSRIDKFGISQPNIQKIGNSGRILIELPGAKDINRVKDLLQTTAEMQFWETFDGQKLFPFLNIANQKIAETIEIENSKNKDQIENVENEKDSVDDAIDALIGDTDLHRKSLSNKKNKLFDYLQPTGQISPVIGYAKVKDTAKINQFLSEKKIRSLLNDELKYTKFLWSTKSNNGILSLFAIKSNRLDKPALEGNVIEDASQKFDPLGINPEVSITMNRRGTKLWAKISSENVGKFVAIVLDNYVYTAPVIKSSIKDGRCNISGNFSIENAIDLANVLKAGKLPAAARIIQSEVVGPSLGQETINASLISFGFAFLLVLIWMIFYYGKVGWFADIALLINILFIFGILTSFGTVLTLPGIAGIILTIGMSVDANVLIFEKIKENIRLGKSLSLAIEEGFSTRGALSAIIDANITTLLTGGILYTFGMGPIQGFAFTLIIGILTSLFTAIFVTRILLDCSVKRRKKLNFSTKMTKNWFSNVNIDFLGKRKISYTISTILLIVGIGSLISNGLNYGVDFVGGRTYIVRFDKFVNPEEITNSLKEAFGSVPEVKTYGNDYQLKITTKYLINDQSTSSDAIVEKSLFEGLKKFFSEKMTIEAFKGEDEKQTIGILSSMKVEPTIADDIKQSSIWAILGSLLVAFLYILFRFKKWQYSFGSVLALFHDVFIVLSVFSIFYKIIPFEMEINQSFVASILTVVGYSLNDTVIVFDIIRGCNSNSGKRTFSQVINKGLNSSLGRTINTSITTLIVLLSIFLFGGDSIKGFVFGLIIGILVGTYSSLFIASPIMYDLTKKN